MKQLLLIVAVSLSMNTAFGQCSVSVNDTLYLDYSYGLNATDIVGQAPFQFNWTVTDGNGLAIPFNQNQNGDSITISAQTIQGAYGCIIYQLCMTDALNCTTCIQADTSELQVPFNCFSAFNTSMIGPNQFSITINNNIPPFLIVQQFMQWTDGDGQGQGMPYMGPGTVITYTPGLQNTNDKFYLCVMSVLTTGGCISCDSIPYSTAGLNEEILTFQLNPNPANEVIKITGDFNVESISIIDITGSIIQRKELIPTKELEIAVDDLPNGIYLLRIETTFGTTLKRFSVQH